MHPLMKTIFLILLIVPILFILSSCSLLPKARVSKEGRPPKSAEEIPSTKETKIGEPVEEAEKTTEVVQPQPEPGGKPLDQGTMEKRDEKALLRQKANVLLNRKEYAQVLNLIGREKRDELMVEYCMALNGLIASGEEKFQKEQYEQAGMAFRKVLNSYPEKKNQREKVDRSRTWIESRLEASSERLMIQGLSEYRGGKLEGAIETWKKILLFNPEDRAAKKAIETAATQQRNLLSIGGMER